MSRPTRRQTTLAALRSTALTVLLAGSVAAGPAALALQDTGGENRPYRIELGRDSGQSGYALAEGASAFEMQHGEWTDDSRERGLPVRIFMPEGDGPHPVVIYSAGHGNSRDSATFLGEHWASHGIASVFVQHPGSDSAAWQGGTPASYRQAMMEIADDPDVTLARGEDISFIIDELERRAEAGELAVDTTRIGLATQGEGARAALAALSQRQPGDPVDITDQRIQAGLVLSPAPLPVGMPAAEIDALYGHIDRPVLHVTSQDDSSAVDPGRDAEARLTSFRRIPADGQYAVAFNDGSGSVFSDADADPQKDFEDYETIQMRTAQASTVMWQAYLNADAGARAWLDGEGFLAAIGEDGTVERRNTTNPPATMTAAAMY